MKTLLAAALLAFLATAAQADTVDITVTTCLCGINDATPIDLQAQLTVEQVTGTFFQPDGAYLFTNTVDEITALTGTVNGYSMTLDQAPYGDGSWIYAPGYGAPYQLGAIYFSADGIPSWMFNDVDNYLEGFAGGNLVTYEATDPVGAPEPATLLLLSAGFIGVTALKLKMA